MNFTLWISFIGTVTILAVTPGPSVLLTTANSMNYGVKKAWGTILGDLSANLLQIILASSGLASIIISSGKLFQIVKWLGVVYLIYIGLKKIIARPDINLNLKKQASGSFHNLYRQGFLISASNPKAIIFFAALFPLFIDDTIPLLPQIIVLAFTYLIIDGTSLFIYAQFATRLKDYLENKEKLRLQNRIAGLLLIFCGIMLSMVKLSGK